MATYQVETDNGTYQVETDDTSAQPTPNNSQDTEKSIMAASGQEFAPANLLRNAAHAVADKTGEFVATSLSEGPLKLHPKMAAAIGTAYQMIPDTLEATLGGEGLNLGAKAAAKAVGESSTVQALKGTGLKEVARLSEKAADLPLAQTAKSTLAQETLKSAKTGIQETEAALGLKNPDLGSEFQGLVSNKQKLAGYAQKVDSITQKGAERLSKITDSQTLHNLKKTIQEGLKSGGENLNDLSRVQLARAKKVVSDALELLQPKLQEALGKYRDIQKVVDELPAHFKQEKQMLNAALVRARNLAKSQQPVRNAAGHIIRGAEYTAGAGALYRLLKGGGH